MGYTIDMQTMTRARLVRLLQDVEGGGPGRQTLYFRPESLPASLTALWPSTDADVLAEVSRRTGDYATGAVVFWSPQHTYVVGPPFPVAADLRVEGWDTAPLRALLGRRYTLGVVLLRLGAYAVGVFDGDALVASKADTRYVKGKHHAGGWSQQRFARRREKQMRELFDEACSVVRSKFTPYERRLDCVFLGGERLTLLAFRKRCPYLQGLADKIAPRILEVDRPGHDALEQAPREIWKSRVLVVERD